MNTKNVSLVAGGIILVAAVMVSYLGSRSMVLNRAKEMPIFIGQELAVEAAPTKVLAHKAQAVPAPKPKMAVPLPIFPPKVSFSVLPQYPASALKQGLAGTTLLSIYVGASGKAENVSVKSSSGASELDQSALAAVSQWKFDPAVQGGAAIASVFEVPIRFEVK